MRTTIVTTKFAAIPATTTITTTITTIITIAIAVIIAIPLSVIPCSGQVTPYLGLNLPPYASPNWNIPLNANSTLLDNYLSGTTPLPHNLSLNGYFDIQEIPAPLVPSAGYERWYASSSTHQLSCLTNSGLNCAPTGGGSGSVTSVGLTVPPGLTVTPSVITSSGTFAVTWQGQIPSGVVPNNAANTSGTAHGLDGFSPGSTIGNLSDGCLTVTSTIIGSAPCLAYPSGSGVAIVSSGSWGTTVSEVNNTVLAGSGGTWQALPAPTFSAANLTSFPTLNQNTTGYAAGLAGCPNPAAVAAGSLCYSNGTNWTILPGNTTGTPLFLQVLSGVPSLTTPPGGGNVSNSGTPTSGQLAVWTGATIIQGLTTLPTTAFPALTGDVTNSSGSLATTVGKVNGGAIPASATLLASNSSSQLTAAALTSADVYVGNGSNLPVGVALSQDISMTNGGVVTVDGILTKSVAALSTFSSAPYLTYNGTSWVGANPFASPTFTTSMTLAWITGTTQCLQVNSSGAVGGTGSACGSGGGGGNVTGPGTSTSGDISLFNNTTGTLLSDAGFGFPLANAHLANSTIGISGTSNEITSSTPTPALGGSTILAIANPFTFPGKWTGIAATTSAATFNIPSSTATITSPVSGDVWNSSGIVKFYDGTNTNSLTTIQSALISGNYPKASGTAGLLADSGIPFGTVANTGAVSTNASFYVPFISANTTGNYALNSASGLAFNPSTGTLTAGSIVDSAISASTSPICPNGTGGAFTTTGCVSANVVASAQYAIPFYSASGTASTLTGASGIYTDSSQTNLYLTGTLNLVGQAYQVTTPFAGSDVTAPVTAGYSTWGEGANGQFEFASNVSGTQYGPAMTPWVPLNPSFTLGDCVSFTEVGPYYIQLGDAGPCATPSGASGTLLAGTGSGAAFSATPTLGKVGTTSGTLIFVASAGGAQNLLTSSGMALSTGGSSNATSIGLNSIGLVNNSSPATTATIAANASGNLQVSSLVDAGIGTSPSTNPICLGTGGVFTNSGCGTGSGVSSLTGDGALITNSASTGAVTITLGTPTAHTIWGNHTGSTATPTYSALVSGDLPLSAMGTITGGTWNGTIIGSAYGGTGVNNSATLALGTSNQNWATLGTGIVKNTTTTGALSDAVYTDVVTLWASGSCSGYLKNDGSCGPGGTGLSSFPVTGLTGTIVTNGLPYFSTSSTLTGGDTGLTYTSNQLAIGSSGNTGTLKLFGSGSGSTTISSPLSGSGSQTITIPTSSSFTLVCLSCSQTFTNSNTFAPTGTSAVPITVNAPSGTTVDLMDLKNNGTTEFVFNNAGAITTGVWNASIIGATYGGTGVNNGSNTLTLGASLTTTGTGAPTLAFPNTTSYTYTHPSATGTLLEESASDTTTTHVLHATSTTGVGTFSAIATGDLPTSVAYNATTTTQTISGTTSPTYITNSGITVPSGYNVVTGSQFEWTCNISKTASNASASSFNIYIGTNGSTSDSSLASGSFTGTASSDATNLDIKLLITTAGSSATGTWVMSGTKTAIGSATSGWYNTTAFGASGTLSSTFNGTTSGLIFGIAYTPGSSAGSATVNNCIAVGNNL